jgi:exopolysaccharide biosynthesis protein
MNLNLKKKNVVLIICIIILDAFFCIGLFILYGPIPHFRNFWITSAMTTMNHQYLAHWFYSDKTINEVMANNIIIEVDEDTDPSLIDEEIEIIYKDRYEEQILEKDPNNDLYKLIDIKTAKYKGFLVVIYDPSKVELAMASNFKNIGQKVSTIAKNNNAKIAINASGFSDPNWMGNGGLPTGSIIQDGKLIWESPRPQASGGVVGFTYDNQLILTKDNIRTAKDKYNLRDAIEFGPFLIVNGKPSFIKGNGGWGAAPRTAIGQRQDGIVLFLIMDGRYLDSIGADMVDLTEIMTNYKAYNAVNLDGGSSTGLIIDNKIINRPTAASKDGLRYIPNAWIVKE